MTENDFNLVRMDVGGHPVITVYGELDLMTAPRLHSSFTEVFEEQPRSVLVDLANVTFIDSTALGTLLVAHRHLADQGGELRLVAVPNAIARVFEIAGLADRFHVYADVDTAASGSPQPTS